jgi:hypothetical protein
MIRSPILLLLPQLLALPGSGHQLLIGDILGILRNWWMSCFFSEIWISWEFFLNDVMVLMSCVQLRSSGYGVLWTFWTWFKEICWNIPYKCVASMALTAVDHQLTTDRIPGLVHFHITNWKDPPCFMGKFT